MLKHIQKQVQQARDVSLLVNPCAGEARPRHCQPAIVVHYPEQAAATVVVVIAAIAVAAAEASSVMASTTWSGRSPPGIAAAKM